MPALARQIGTTAPTDITQQLLVWLKAHGVSTIQDSPEQKLKLFTLSDVNKREK